MGCKGSEEKILEVLGQIRGDYAVILVEGDQIFIMKDYFGKRSLLVGMGENHLLLTSAPHEEFLRPEDAPDPAGDGDEEEGWRVKY